MIPNNDHNTTSTHIATFDYSIDDGHLLKRSRGSFDKWRHEAELSTVFLQRTRDFIAKQ
jgi:hypothetical protein